MTKQEILEKLYALHRFGIKPGLERIANLCNKLGNPQNDFPTIHVAGTNGKGTVCSTISSIYSENGYKVGLYTSPHLVKFNERIRINGKEIPDEEMLDILTKLFAISENTEITFFELTTALAFEYFKREKVDIAIIETGMGGRFDATNILLSELSIITSISLEHQEYLGNTIDEIAYEKAGIIKANKPILSSVEDNTANDIIINRAIELNSQFYQANEIVKSEDIRFSIDKELKYSAKLNNDKIIDISSFTPCQHQIKNINTAISAVNLLNEKFPVNTINIQQGIKNVISNTGFRGRFEIFRKEPPLIFDTAHNPSAIQTTVESLDSVFPEIPRFSVLFAAMSDKSISEMLEILKPKIGKLIITQAQIERAAEIQMLIEISNQLGIDNIVSFKQSNEAIRYVLKDNLPSIVIGSFFHIGEIINYLENW